MINIKQPIIRVFECFQNVLRYFSKAALKAPPWQESFLSLKCFTVPFLVT